MAISAKATQDFVPIKEIRDGVVILKDGSMRSILLASSINFALKSADEQQAILMQFQDFLNSLDFSVQIFIESRRLDIRPYLALLEQRYKEQTIDLMKLQTREYIEFIKNFTESVSIMTKSFFIIVPYMPPVLTSSGGLNILNKKKGTTASKVLDATAQFEENRSQLDQRLSVVEQGLSRCGIRVIKLGSEEMVELYYKLFNPGETEKPIQLNQ
jgi:type IV secretory pathway VirB4 component